MAHGILHGIKRGVKHGVKHGGLTLAPSGPMDSVTRDAASGLYFPASSAEWTTTLSVAGVTKGNPTSLYLCQEPSGSLADSIGSVTLAQSGAGHLYQQAVAGFTRLGVKCVDGTAGQKWINSTVAPDPNATSVIYLAVINFPAAPAAARDLFANGGTLDCRYSTTGRITFINGASTTATQSVASGTHIIALKHDVTSIFQLYTELESNAGTWAAVASNPMFVLGGQTAAAAGVTYLYSCIFSGTGGTMLTAEVRSVFQTLGWTVAW